MRQEKLCEYLKSPYRKPTQVDRKRILRPTGEWFHFDLVPEETELRRGAADYTGDRKSVV